MAKRVEPERDPRKAIARTWRAYVEACQSHADPAVIAKVTADYNHALMAYPGDPHAIPYEVTRPLVPTAKKRKPAPEPDDEPAATPRRAHRDSRTGTSRRVTRRRHTQPSVPHIDGLLPLF